MSPPRKSSTSSPSIKIVVFLINSLTQKKLENEVFNISYFSGPLTIATVLFQFDDMTSSSIFSREKENIINNNLT